MIAVLKVLLEPAALFNSQRRILPLSPSGIELHNCTTYQQSHGVSSINTGKSGYMFMNVYIVNVLSHIFV